MGRGTVIRNGIDLDRVTEVVDSVSAGPERARFRFRARNRWVDGCENRSTVYDFDGLGDTHITRHKPFEFTNAEPPVLLGHDESASALEFVLHALAGSITTAFVLRAAALGVTIDTLFTEVEGEIDVRAILAVDGFSDTTFSGIRVGIEVTADCSDATLDGIIEFARSHAPVCGALMRPVPVHIERV